MWSLIQALAIANGVLERGRTARFAPLGVAVLDPGGRILAVLRDERASIGRSDIAMAKRHWAVRSAHPSGRENYGSFVSPALQIAAVDFIDPENPDPDAIAGRFRIAHATTPMDAATRHGGALMDLPVGEIKSAKLADILLVEGDPTMDVTVLQNKNNLHAIMKDGRFVKSPAIH